MPLPWATVPLVLASAGPVLRYDVVYLGSRVGSIEAQSVETEDGWVTTTEARSARWYRPIYDLHDRIRTTWSTGGTVQTRRFCRRVATTTISSNALADGVVVENRKKQPAVAPGPTTSTPILGLLDPVAAVLLVARRIGRSSAAPAERARGASLGGSPWTHRNHRCWGRASWTSPQHRTRSARNLRRLVDRAPPVRGLQPRGRVRVELVAQEAPDG